MSNSMADNIIGIYQRMPGRLSRNGQPLCLSNPGWSAS
ncbi:Uncharacterised protein [Serratia fonticola]|uniref:Uncharacterized protein n=1 Tax=Serratia fonticola TaxID=47917 RepID=A0A4U9U670_SERFO|nr:Uncharacterised protein [Serratia fonticola]